MSHSPTRPSATARTRPEWISGCPIGSCVWASHSRTVRSSPAEATTSRSPTRPSESGISRISASDPRSRRRRRRARDARGQCAGRDGDPCGTWLHHRRSGHAAAVASSGVIHQHAFDDPGCCIQVPAVARAGYCFRLGASLPTCERFGDLAQLRDEVVLAAGEQAEALGRPASVLRTSPPSGEPAGATSTCPLETGRRRTASRWRTDASWWEGMNSSRSRGDELPR
jgi:hypothetical protein